VEVIVEQAKGKYSPQARRCISIILPVYNESQVIRKFSDVLFAVLDTLNDRYSFEVIYCLDKSTDNTRQVINDICNERPEAKLLAMSRRFGHQMSLVAGMDHCVGDAAIMMDCDLEHPPELIPALLEKFEEGYDVVHTKREYSDKASMFKRATSAGFYRILSALSSVKLEEGSADFRLVSRRCLNVFTHSIREQHQFLRGLFRWVGFEQCTLEFTAGYRAAGKSKYSLRKLFIFAGNGIISFSKMPLFIVTTVGAVFSILGFLYGVYTIIVSFLKATPPGWPSSIALIAFLGGLQLAALGIVGRYIGEIFDEVKGRPLYILEDE
jgi:dolichol-phosphate mannosyltransferase